MYSVCVSEVNLFCADWCPSKTKALILFKTGKEEHISERVIADSVIQRNHMWSKNIIFLNT